jgi:hypothetical protein
VPYLTGTKPGAPHEAIYLRKYDEGRFAVRQGGMKLVIPERNARTRLYDLEADIGESQDLVAQRPEDLERLDSLRSAWNALLIEPAFDGLIMQKPRKPKHR